MQQLTNHENKHAIIQQDLSFVRCLACLNKIHQYILEGRDYRDTHKKYTLTNLKI